MKSIYHHTQKNNGHEAASSLGQPTRPFLLPHPAAIGGNTSGGNTSGNNSGVVQRVKGNTFEDSIKKFQAKSKTGKRHPGDAEFLARARYARNVKNRKQSWLKVRKESEKLKKVPYKQWKKNREAQHLIPASVGMKYGLPNSLINSPENGMMLLSGRSGSTTFSKEYKTAKGKSLGTRGKLMHVGYKNRIAHPDYNSLVEKEMDKLQKKHGKTIPHTAAKTLMKQLRTRHRKADRGAKKLYSDQLK